MDDDHVSLLEEFLDKLPPEESSERAQVMCRLGFELYWGGDHKRMEALARDGLDMARRLGDPHTLGAVLQVAALLYDDIGDADSRLSLSREAMTVAEGARDLTAATLARGYATWALLELGDLAGYEQAAIEGAAQAAEFRLPRMSWYASLWQTVIALVRGHVDDAEPLAMQTLQLGQAADDLTAMQIFGAQMFSIRREQGRLDEFDAHVRSMADEFPAVPAWYGALALLLAELGNAEESAAYLEIVCRDGLSGMPRDNAWAAGLSLVVDAAFLVDSTMHARELYDAFTPFADRFVCVGQAECFGSVHRFLGQLAALDGRADDAITHFERGIAADTAMGGVRNAVRGQWALARTLLRRDQTGDAERARALIADGLAAADELNLVSLGAHLRELTTHEDVQVVT
jgi:tetratricopeptide (TPR) repeat protein